MAIPYASLPHRAILSLTGSDTIALLERLVTNNTEDWQLGETRYGALLTPQGKVIADYLAVRTEDGILLDVDKEALPDLAKRLKMFRLRADVQIEPREDLSVIAGLEPTSELGAISDTVLTYTDPRFTEGRTRALVTTAPSDAQAVSDYHADRIAHGVPEQGSDFGAAEVFPADINMDHYGGVDLKKGCFVGQEVVSRMHRRGKVRKRTLSLRSGALEVLSGPLRGAHEIGQITSSVEGQALTRVRIDRLKQAMDKGEALSVDETPVTITKPDWLEAEMTALVGNG
ncbi:folate-binding protein [Hyphomonas sp. FCG-A18]|uniref:CAF17-like 4Fe-4S cluster assembly/insertion protein YgfZ n=1 Tax=Hyphomonas sp. FCG-A18 TaxID=3080019 RepID=UPI002B2C69BF|nr:folate-binding protein [Hyphomonas sp. FCG-A18]